METPRIANEKQIQDSIFCGKGDAGFWNSKGPILEDYVEKVCAALCSSLVHTASRATMFTLSRQQGN
jgi:hypothetical protein